MTLAVPILAFAAPATQNARPEFGPVTSDSEIIASLRLDLPELQDVKKTLDSGNLDEAKKAYLLYRRTKSTAKYEIMPDQQPRNAVAEVDEIGDEICNHYIRNPYPTKPRAGDMGKDFNWKFNPVASDSPDFTHEWTWCAVSRTLFWRQLAAAYWKTRNEKYAREWVTQLLDFARKNPSPAAPEFYGPTLWRSLDSSERMYDSWPYAYAHFLNSASFTPEAQWAYLKLIQDHAHLLMTGLSNPDRTSNWVSSECFGLYAAGVLFPELRDAELWRNTAMNRLVIELNRQVRPDGFQAELTPNYHYFTLGTLVGPYKLAKLNNLSVPDIFHDKLLAMYQAPVLVMDQSGATVPTNDSNIVNAASMARQGLELFPDDPLLLWASTGGKKGRAPAASTMLNYAGFYAMRGSWNRNDLFLFFRGGPAGIGHQHEDMLQVVMRAWNKTLLFDPGSYAYDRSEWRRYAVGTPSHNTVIVDGKWQHRGPSALKIDPVNNPWVSTPLYDYVSSTYTGGYQENIYNSKKQYAPFDWAGDLDKSITHTRKVLFLKPYYALVLDSLTGTGHHIFDAHFHLDSPSAMLDAHTQAAFSQNEGNVQLALFPLDRQNLKTEITKGQKDPMLGWAPAEQRAIPTVRFRKEQNAPAAFATMLYPYQGSQPALVVSPLNVSGQNIWSQSIQTSYEIAEIAMSQNDTAQAMDITSNLLGSCTAQAATIIIRRPLDKKLVTIGGSDVSRFQSASLAFELSNPAALLWQAHNNQILFCNASTQDVQITITAPFAAQLSLPTGAWIRVTPGKSEPAPKSPLNFKPLATFSAAKPYAEYLNAQKGLPDRAMSFRIHASDFKLPANVALKSKVGAQNPVAVGWDAAGSQLSVQVPDSGWYRIRMRYCTQGEPVRTLLVAGQIPFAQAESFSLPSTIGSGASDGWSSSTNDWKELTLGADNVANGWQLYLPKGQLTFRNDSGGGCNIDWIELLPVHQP